MYTTGKIHKYGVRFLKTLAHHASKIREIPKSTLLNYYVKLINFALIREASRTIYIKCRQLGSYVDKDLTMDKISTFYFGSKTAMEVANPPVVVNYFAWSK